MIRGVHHVAIHTPDLDRLAAFYLAAFGFTPATSAIEWSGDRQIDTAIGVPRSSAKALMLRAGNCYVELFQYSAPAPRDDAPLRPFDHGYTHFCVDVLDIDAEHHRLTALGMRFVSDRPTDFGEIKSVYGYDPDGNLIEIQEVASSHPFAFEPVT